MNIIAGEKCWSFVQSEEEVGPFDWDVEGVVGGSREQDSKSVETPKPARTESQNCAVFRKDCIES